MHKRMSVAAAAAVFAAAALFYLYMTGEGEGAGIPCPFYQLTGLYCVGCGASRALRSVLHLDFAQAMGYNAFFTLLLPAVAAYFLGVAVSLVKYGKDKFSEKIPRVIPITAAVIGVAFMILRNMEAFSFLAPHILS